MKIVSRALLVTFALTLSVTMTPEPAHALIERVFPNTTTTTVENARAYVATTGGLYALQAPIARFKVFVATGQINSSIITLEGICNSFWTKGSRGSLRLEVWAGNGGETEGPQIINTPNICASSTGNVTTATLGSYGAVGAESTIPGHEGYATYLVRVTQSGSFGGGQAFRIWTNPGNFVTFRERLDTFLGGAPTTTAFATINDQFFTRGPASNPSEADFNYDFGPNCDLTAPLNVFIKWFDADAFNSNDGGAGVQFTLRDVTSGSNVFMNVFDYNGPGGAARFLGGNTVIDRSNPFGIPNGTLIGGNGAGSYREASFTIQPGHDYTWEWRNVDRNNGVQLWMPFSEFNFGRPCSAYQGSASADCTAVRGWFGDGFNASQNNYDIRVQTRRAGGSWTTTWDESASDATPTSPLAGNHGFNVTIPTGSLSNTVATQYRVHAYNDSRTTQLFTIRGTTTIAGGPCVGEWDYDPTLRDSISVGADARAGETFRMAGYVRNNGDGDGRGYRQIIRVRSGGPGIGWQAMAGRSIDITGGSAGGASNNGAVKQRSWSGLGAIGATSQTGERYANYRVRTNPTHGDQVCFENRVDPAAGVSSPLLSTTDTIDYSWDANDPGGTNGHPQDVVHTECITVYNQRFSLSDPNVVEPQYVFPSQDIDFDITVFNNGALPPGADGGIPGRTIPIQITGTQNVGGSRTVNIPSNGTMDHPSGSFTTTQTFTVNSNVQPGDDVCVEITYGPLTGYSDGDRSIDSGRFTEEYCTVVAEQPFITVSNHDVWAGAVWNANSECNTTSNSEGEIKISSANFAGSNLGGWTEYAAYAIEGIAGFGTLGAERGPSGTATGAARSFANTNLSDLGRILGAGGSAPPRCIPDYFGDLFDPAGVGGPNINSIGSAGDRTYYFSGNQTLNGNTTISSRKTVVIDGDLRIRGNINYGGFAYDAANREVNGPSLAIIVRGNIFIDESVENISGFIVAQPRADGSGGIIDTCSNGFNASVTLLSTLVCEEQLTFYGAVIAEHLLLRRTYGGVVRDFTNTQNGGAEEFNFDPMLYLNKPLFEPVGGAQGREFPFLQIKDLPPVF